MARLKVFEGNQTASSEATDALERLVAENFELRHTAVELVLQTRILRERLCEAVRHKPVRHRALTGSPLKRRSGRKLIRR
jgi:hypothetical protein